MAEEETVVSNYAFIDGQNLHSGVTQLGWKLDHKKMREYLKDEFNVGKAFIFIGFMEEQQDLYTALQDAGFILVFKPLVRYYDGTIKGNVDADMVLKVMIEINNYEQAVVISGDGDFHGLIRHLISVNKLKKLIIPNKDNSSSLFERISEFDQRKFFIYMDNLKSKLTYGDVHQKRRRPAKSRSSSKAVRNRTKKTS